MKRLKHKLDMLKGVKQIFVLCGVLENINLITLNQKKSNVKCAWCKKSFYKNHSRKKSSKSGLFFCCRKHNDFAQRTDGLPEINPSHYGTGRTGRNSSTYRRIAFKNHPNKCNKCSYDEHFSLLDVHHIDKNHNNNDISNLEILCVMCHRKYHYGIE